MPRLVVLPFAVEPRDETERADLLIGRPLAADLAERLRVRAVEASGTIDAEYVDPLVGGERGGCYLYTRELAGELASTLTARLGLDGVVFARLELGGAARGLRAEAWMLDASGARWSWQGEAGAGDFQVLNIELARALHEALSVEPSAREAERLERVTTRSLPALRMMALAEALGDASSQLVLVQRGRLLEAAVRADGGYIEAVLALAETRAQMGDPMGAHEILSGWLERMPDAHEVRLHAVRMALRAGLVDAAVDAARVVSEADPYELDAHRLLSSALIAAGRPEEAAFAAREALWRFPGDLALKRSAALADLASGRGEAAIEALSALVAELPEHPELPLELGHALELDGRLEEALAAYRAALDLGAEPAASTAIQLGRFLLVMGYPAEAAAVLGRAQGATTSERSQLGAYLAVSMLTLDFGAGLSVALARMGTAWLDEAATPDAATTFVQIELALLQETELEGVEVLVETWRSQDTASAGETLLLAWWALALALHRGDVARASEIFAGLESPTARAAALRRLEWLIARSRHAGRAGLSERALALRLELADEGDSGVLLRVASERLRLGERESVLLWLSPLLDSPQVALELVALVARLLVEDERAGTAREVVEAAASRAAMERTAGLAAVRAWLASLEGDAAGFGAAAGEALFAVAEERSAVVELLARSLEGAPQLGRALVSAVEEFLAREARDEAQRGFAAQLLLLCGASEAAAASVPGGALREPEALLAAALLARRRGAVDTMRELLERAVARPGAVAARVVLATQLLTEGGAQAARASRLLEEAWLGRPQTRGLRALLRHAVGAMLVGGGSGS